MDADVVVASRVLRWWCVVLAVVAGTVDVARATSADGVLEVAWGDPLSSPGASRAAPVVVATIVADDGTRTPVPVDAVTAHAWRGLAGERVARVGRGEGAAAISPITPATAPPSIIGTSRWATLLCRYADYAIEPFAREHYDAVFDGTPGSLAHYWRVQANDRVDFAGSAAFGWFVLPKPRTAYVNGLLPNLNLLFEDCAAAASGEVDIAAYDGVNIVLNVDLGRYLWGGRACRGDGSGTRCWRATWTVAHEGHGLAGLAHEMGHAFGLPHANNGDGDASPYDNPWDVMSDPWRYAAIDPRFGVLPHAPSMWSRARLGWIADARRVEIDRDGAHALRLDAATDVDGRHAQMIVLRPASAPASRHVVIEARRRIGPYDAKLPAEGVVIHAIDEARAEPAWLVDRDVPPSDDGDQPGTWLVAGQSWTSPDGTAQLVVDADAGTGYRVTVLRGDRRVMADGFE